MSTKQEEALALVEEKCQDIFRFGDKHLPEHIRVAVNDLWRNVLVEQKKAP